MPQAVPAGLCDRESFTVRARSMELWLPHAAWLGLRKDLTALRSSYPCEHGSSSLLQTKRTRNTRLGLNTTLLLLQTTSMLDSVRNETHDLTPSGKQHWMKRSSRAKQAASVTHLPTMAAHQLLVGSGEAAKQHSKTKSAAWSMFVLPKSVMLVVKTLCIISSVLAQLSPIPQVRQFHKLKDTGEVDAAPYVSIMFGGLQWSFYGAFALVVTGNPDAMVLVYSNMVGAFLGFYYLHGFLANCKDTQSRQRLLMYCKVTATLAAVEFLVTISVDAHQALLFCGLVSSISGMMGACSLLTTMPQVFYSGCSSSINMPLLCTGMFGSSVWLMCGLMMHDLWVIAPCFVSLLLQSCAAAVVVIFPRKLDDSLITSKIKRMEQKTAIKDISSSKAILSSASDGFQPLHQQERATSGEAPDYGTMPLQMGATGSTF